MTKKEIRKIYLEKRQALSIPDLNRLDSLLLIRFQQLALGDIKSVLSFWPMEEKAEINTHLIVDYLSFRIPGLQLAYPVMSLTENVLKPVLVVDDTVFVKNVYGIAEPAAGEEMATEDIDLVIVPLLAFDTRGYRVGYGKGFYDRFLKNCREDVLSVGFCYFDPEQPVDDINEFDVPLNICITPNKIYEF